MGSTQNQKEKQKEDKIQEQQKMFLYKEMVKKNAMTNPELHYKFLQKIGEGSYSEVFKAQSLHTNQYRVIKRVARKSDPKSSRSLLNEFDILRQMVLQYLPQDHPNIIKMYQMFEDENYHYIVTEYLNGKDALDLLIAQKNVDETMAFNIFYHCLLALNYLHTNKVMHRDVKLENIIYDEQSTRFKLIDFGSALRFSSCSPRERRSTGTIHYMAPEVINKYYNKKCDVWSLGVVLYVLLCGNAPFMGQTNDQIIKKTLKENVVFDKKLWQCRSKQVKQLLVKMLDKNFEKRPNISELVNDPWVLHHKSKNKISKPQHEEVCICLERLQRFRKIKITDIQLGILLFMVHFIVKIQNDLSLTRTFLRMDVNGDGQICEKQMIQAYRQYLNYDIKTAQVFARQIIKILDLNASGGISYSQFVLGATDLRKVFTHTNISKAFQYIDTDGSQKLSMLELQAKLGDHIDETQYHRLVNLFDANGDGQIDIEQFSKMIADLLKDY